VFEDKIEKLAELRKEFEERESDYKKAKLDFESSFVYKNYKDCELKISELESKIRDEADANFKTTGEKQPHPAIEVQQKLVICYDGATALEYAKTELKQAVVLDKKFFDGTMREWHKKNQLPDFVKAESVPWVKIDKDLTPFLESGEKKE